MTAQAQHIPAISLEVRLEPTRKLIRAYVDRYNAVQKSNGDKIKPKHIQLLFEMVKLYRGRISGLGKVDYEAIQSGLPSLRTSNGALVRRMGGSITKQTIINLRKRLEAAGLLKYKKWHGTNAPYEYWINPRVLFLGHTVAGQWNPRNGNMARLFFDAMAKFFGHTVSGMFPDQATSKKRNTEGEKSPGTVENVQPGSAAGDFPAGSIQETNSGNSPNVPNFGETAEATRRETAPPTCAAPPREATANDEPPKYRPNDIDRALAHLNERQAATVKLIASQCWAEAARTIYADMRLSASQKRAGFIGLAEYIAWHVKPARYFDAKIEIIWRIQRADRWYRELPERFRLLPSAYFDMRRAGENGGFRRTEQWRTKHNKQIWHRTKNTLLTKSVKKYLLALLPNSTTDRELLHHQLTQKIRKKFGPKAVIQFEQQVNDAILHS